MLGLHPNLRFESTDQQHQLLLELLSIPEAQSLIGNQGSLQALLVGSSPARLCTDEMRSSQVQQRRIREPPGAQELLQLPTDVLAQVFSHLTYLRDKLAFSVTCRRSSAASSDPRAWTSVDIGDLQGALGA